MKPLLIVLPSRGRPDKIKKCIDSYISTCPDDFSELSIQLDSDDKKLEEYHQVIKEYDGEKVKCEVSRRPSENRYCITRIINRKFYRDKDRDYYCVINDDMVFETPGWDRTLAIEWAISTCKDPNMVEKHGSVVGNTPVEGFPIISVIDGRICRALNWLQMPELDGCCGDNVWFWIGIQARNLIYNKNVIFYHNHQAFGKSEMDDTYLPVYGNNNQGATEDFKKFIDWTKYRASNQIRMVRELIEKNIGVKNTEELCQI